MEVYEFNQKGQGKLHYIHVGHEQSLRRFIRSELSANNFKCLIFVQGLISANDAEIKCRVLNKLENQPNLTLQQIAEDCQRFVSVRQDSKNIEELGVVHIRKVRQKKEI